MHVPCVPVGLSALCNAFADDSQITPAEMRPPTCSMDRARPWLTPKQRHPLGHIAPVLGVGEAVEFEAAEHQAELAHLGGIHCRLCAVHLRTSR